MIDECIGLSYEGRFKVTGLPTLEERRIRGDLIEIYKMLNGLDKVDYKKFLNISELSKTRGHKKKLYKNSSRLRY